MCKRVLLVAAFIFIMLFSGGCFDRREVDDMAYVLAIGMDLGTTEKLHVTLQVVSFKSEASPGTGQEGGGEGEAGGQAQGYVDGTFITTVDSPTFFDGLHLANLSTSRQLNLMHAKLIVISEDLARSHEMDKYIAAMNRYREIRRISNFIVARGTAEEFIRENKTTIGKDPSKSAQRITQQGEYTSYYTSIRLFDFYNAIKSTWSSPVAILGGVNSFKNQGSRSQDVDVEEGSSENAKGGNFLAGNVPRTGGVKRELFGLAVFRGPVMVGELTGTEARDWEIVTGNFKRGFFNAEDPEFPGYLIPMDVRPNRPPQVKVKLGGDIPEILVTIRLEGEIAAIQSRQNYEDPKLMPELEQALEQQIKGEIDFLIRKCQQDYRADIFGFGRKAVSYFPTIKDWEDYRWLQRFPTARVDTEVEFLIRRTGMMLKSSPITPYEEAE